MVGLTGYVIVSIFFNPITGRVFQITYVVLTVIIFHRERRLRMIKGKHS